MSKVLLILVLFFGFVVTSKPVTFTTPRQILLPNKQTAIASGDLNNDGLPDLIIGGDPVQGQLGKIRVMLGKGNGNFHPFTEYRVGYNPNFFPSPFVEQILVKDIDLDGHLDVLVSHNIARVQEGGSELFVTILYGDGQGNLQEMESISFFNGQIGNLVTGIDFTDFNLDGQTDIVIGCSASGLGRVFGLRSLGNRTFQRFGPITTGSEILGIETGFTNADAYQDLVTISGRGVFILHGNGSFYSTAEFLDRDIHERSLIVEDFNKDGRADIAVNQQFTPTVRIYLNSARGFSETPTIYPTNFTAGKLNSGDINNDGNKDLILIEGFNGSFQIIYGNGNGTFGASEMVVNDLPIGEITFADFDLNGKTDIAAAVVADPPAKQAALFLQSPNQNRYFTDFTGDGKSDFTVFRPNTGTWWTQNSSNYSYRATNFGLANDKIVAGNYDGDNKADVAVFRNGIWYILQSSDNSLKIDYWGLASDIPVPADYENDGEMEIAVYRPSESVWYIKDNNSYQAIKWGISTDKPVAADYDGDGKTDIAVYRPSEGNWYIRQSSNGELSVQRFGNGTDKLVPADYDGDGKTDLAVFRPSESYWYILQSRTETLRFEKFGLPTDLPVPSDFDGDNKTDIAVFRADEGNWYISGSRNNALIVNKWGTNTDLPITVNY